jgi:hypothetical protein
MVKGRRRRRIKGREGPRVSIDYVNRVCHPLSYIFFVYTPRGYYYLHITILSFEYRAIADMSSLAFI